MNRDFRPTQIQLNYLNVDILPHLEELGFDVENYEYLIHSIDWYNWDNQPRWFVHITRYSPLGDRLNYVEVDMTCDSWNGGDNPLGDISIELAGHGYPCSSVQVAVCEDGDYTIFENS